MESNIIILNPPKRAKRKEANEEALQKETSHIRLVDKETALRMEKEEHGRWMTVSELAKKLNIQRMTIFKRIRRGKYIVTQNNKKCNQYSHQYLIWVTELTINQGGINQGGINQGGINQGGINQGGINQFIADPDAIPSAIPSAASESVLSDVANLDLPDSNPEFDINWELDINQQVTRQKNKKSKKKFDEEHARKLGLEPEEVQIGGETKILYMSKDYKENKRKEEAKGGIWVGVKEYAEVKRIKKSTVFRRIKKEFKYIIAIDPKTNQHVLLLLIGKRDTKEAIFKYRQSQQIELLVPRKELLNMHKNGAIDLNIFDSLLSVPQKATLRLKGYLRKEILNTVWKHIKISEIKPEMDCPSQT